MFSFRWSRDNLTTLLETLGLKSEYLGGKIPIDGVIFYSLLSPLQSYSLKWTDVKYYFFCYKAFLFEDKSICKK